MTISKAQQKKNRKLWVEALRSGKYKQGKKMLRTSGDQFCCLGVLADISGCSWEFDEKCFAWRADSVGIVAPERAVRFVGLQDATGVYKLGDQVSQLWEENDLGTSFQEIADIIESEPLGLFHD